MVTVFGRDYFHKIIIVICTIIISPVYSINKIPVYGTVENIEGGDRCILKCEHSFHLKCILPWLFKRGVKSTCPNCRGPIDICNDNKKSKYTYKNSYFYNNYINESSSAHI